jgi:HAD superfamily hydrolase (TIGR01509 family)
MSSQLRGVLLDIDGTLLDSNDAHARAWIEAMAQHGHRLPYGQVRQAVGMGSDNLLPSTLGIEKDSPEGEAISKQHQEIFRARYQPHLKPFPGARELLERMRGAGLKLAVASSSHGPDVQRALEIIGIEDLTQAETSASDADRSKPDPDIVAAALRRLGLDAGQVLMLGDTPYDVQAAGKLGIGVVALRCGGFADQDLKGAIALYNDPADLLAHFAESPFASAYDGRPGTGPSRGQGIDKGARVETFGKENE